MAYTAQLANDFGRFRADFMIIGKHISNAQAKFGDAERRLDRFGSHLERAAEWEIEAAPEPAQTIELPRALDAA
jgi:hypothetical protein